MMWRWLFTYSELVLELVQIWADSKKIRSIREVRTLYSFPDTLRHLIWHNLLSLLTENSKSKFPPNISLFSSTQKLNANEAFQSTCLQSFLKLDVQIMPLKKLVQPSFGESLPHHCASELQSVLTFSIHGISSQNRNCTCCTASLISKHSQCLLRDQFSE